MTIKTVSDLLSTAISKDTHRLILRGVCEDCDKDGVFRVSTDTHRLVVVKMGEHDGKPSKRVLYPEQVALESMTAHYPDWRKVVPETHTKSCRLPIEPLRAAIQSALVAGRWNASRCRIRFNGNLAVVSARSEELGVASFEIPCLLPENMDGFEVALNGKFVLDSLPKFTNEDHRFIKLEMTESTRPVVVTYPECDGLWKATRVVIMPMALV